MSKENFINARELQQFLGNKSKFLDWIKIHICINKLKENEDYYIKKNKINHINNIKVAKVDYYLTRDSTKKIILSQARNKIANSIKNQLENGKFFEDIIKDINKKKESEFTIIKYDEKEYPEQLRIIKNPPKELYVKGNIENLKEKGIAVIGTRNCTM